MFSISNSLVSRFDPAPAPGEAPLRWIGWHLVQGLVGNTVIAVLITVLIRRNGYFDQFGTTSCIRTASASRSAV